MEMSLISVASSPEKETTEELILELHTQRTLFKQWLTTSQGLLKYSVWPSAWRRQRYRFTKIPHSRCIAHITINGHLLTYLSCVISNDAMITKDLDHLLAKASSSFGHLRHRMWQSHPLRLMTKVRVRWQLSSALFCMLWKPGCCAESIYSCWNASTRGNCVYHGNTLAGLRHKRRGSREG